jgi:hypothetical protein
MIKPMGVLLILGLALVLMMCLVLVLYALVRGARNRAWKHVIALGVAAIGLATINTWMVTAAAPKGARVVGELTLPDGRLCVLRHYRTGWFEYPKAVFYVCNGGGTWTRFELIAELVDPEAATLLLDDETGTVPVPGVGLYQPGDDTFRHVDGSASPKRALAVGVSPGQEAEVAGQ